MCVVVMILGDILQFDKIIKTLCVQVVAGVAVYGILLLILKDNTLKWLLNTIFGGIAKKLKRN